MIGRTVGEILRVLEADGNPLPLLPVEKERVSNRLLRARAHGSLSRKEVQVLTMRLGLDEKSGNKPDTDLWPAPANASA